jgi:hypothetical protein
VPVPSLSAQQKRPPHPGGLVALKSEVKTSYSEFSVVTVTVVVYPDVA